MSTLHNALTALRPVDFSEVPVDDDIDNYIRDIFSEAELVANSVPPPVGGDDFLHANRALTDVNHARSASEMTVSKARPPPPDPEHAGLYKSWGKPLKLNAKDNPLEIAVYKMAGNDRHGAWFARRSIHEGLGFEKWKKAMQLEFEESLAVQGSPGEGNVRGIGSDKRVERKIVEGVGKLEVYQLSAQFPGPVAPREFVTLLLTSDTALSEKSAPHIDSSDIAKRIPRHFMIVSKPVTHPDAPPREGLVLGQYESVEMIREIPLAKSKSMSTTDLLNSTKEKSRTRERGSTIGFTESRGPDAKGEKRDLGKADDEDELNPVEWIMVTRSDPGGGIPRFMVERGTPGSIVADASKFLNWACAKDDLLHEDEDQLDADKLIEARKSVDSEKFSAVGNNAYLAGVGQSIADRPVPPSSTRTRSPNSIHKQQQSGIFSSITNSMPTAVQNALPDYLRPHDDEADFSDSSDSSSALSFASAEQYNTAISPSSSSKAPSLTSNLSTHGPDTDTPSTVSKETQSQYDKELSKIERQKSELAAKLARQRERDEKATRDATLKGADAATKAQERHERHKRRQEEKYAKELRKLDARREKEARKLEERKRKEADKNALSKAQRERDEWKAKAEVLQKENKVLKEQVGDLQRENTALVTRMGKLEGGLPALKAVQEDMALGRNRANSGESIRSGVASVGKESGLKRVETIETKS